MRSFNALLFFLPAWATAIPLSSHEKRGVVNFDYIVVGGGTGGLTIANRLSEDPNVQVAVIEVGTFYQASNTMLSSTPAGDVMWVGASPLDTNPLVDWDFVTQPQAGANNRKFHYARGKCLGGSSAMNYMIYQRPDKGSLQRWADAVGDQSYTWDNMLPFYKKSTQFTPPKSPPRAANATPSFDQSAFTPAGSPLQVSYANYAQPFSSWMGKGLNAIGLPAANDFNSGTLNGTNYCSSTINPVNEKRDSSQTSFYNTDTQFRSNLKVFQGTLAKKIVFDSNKRATGVKIDIGVTLTARKEIIISAGAFHSPQLLMVSGIGPAATLQKFNIPVIANRSAVGKGMEDHIFFGPSYRVNVVTFTTTANDSIVPGTPAAVEYFVNKRGPLTSPQADYLGWEQAPQNLITPQAASVLGAYPASWPDIEYLSGAGYIGNFQNLVLQQPQDGYQYATILGALVKPQSKGTVTISSSDTKDLPIIDPNWFTDPTDQSVGLAIYKRLRAAWTSNAMKPVLADPVEYFPGPSVATDDQIMSTIRDTLMTVWHASCTCRMGKADDVNAVVDSKARVIGVQGLRVVDASSFALLPPGHPQSTVYALAEKIANDIKNGN